LWAHTDGQGNAPPYPSFFSNATGNITTPQGGRFNVRATEPENVAFVSQWDNYPNNVSVQLSDSKVQAGDVVWLLVSGSTTNMQTRLANAQINFEYTDGTAERLELVPPLNYWSLTPVAGTDYDYVRDGFCLPPVPPPTVQLGEANRAMVYSWRAKAPMASVTLEALSLEVVIGLLAVSVSHAPSPTAVSAAANLQQAASKTDDDRAARRAPNSTVASNSKGTKSRSVQLWACGDDKPVPPYGSGAIETNVFEHIENITSVSICGLSLAANGTLVGNTPALTQKAQLYAGEMGLAVYPLIGGNLSSLHAAMARADAFIAESVSLAVDLVADGWNVDLEIGTQSIKPVDTQRYLSFLDAWAAGLEKEGLELQYDLGGCNDPYSTDFMGLTCKQLAASKLHRLISMDTYAGPIACGGACNLTTALALDKAALCADAEATGAPCARYMPGLMMGKPGALANLSAPELEHTMDWLLGQGVTSISLWAGAPTEAWWAAMGHFLHAPME
jgi:hypothetical protein